MSALPIDIFGLVITHSDLGAINALARSCKALANIVRDQSRHIADALATTHYDGRIQRLPNGTLHGPSLAQVEDGWIMATFDLGAATYWCHYDSEWGAAWGMSGFPYAISCEGVEYMPHCCWVEIEYARGKITVCTDGVITYSLMSVKHCPTWRVRAPHGYFTDGRIDVDVVGPWVESAISRVIDETGRPDVFVSPKARCVRSKDAAFDVLSRIELLSVER